MKTKYWILLFAALAVLLTGVSLLLIPKEQAAFLEVWSEGKLLYTLPLHVDTRLEITTDRGSNIITVENGKASVSYADCPDKTCMAQGERSNGQIVCLPNRLVLKFTGKQTVDGISG